MARMDKHVIIGKSIKVNGMTYLVGKYHQAAVKAVSCPYCKAEPTVHCKSLKGKYAGSYCGTHMSRVSAYESAMASMRGSDVYKPEMTVHPNRLTPVERVIIVVVVITTVLILAMLSDKI